MTETVGTPGPGTPRQPQGGESLTVGQVAGRFGVTRRTLHHYDAIGLVVPSARSSAGYRLYSDPDLTRLQNVVVYRRLGFALEEVALLLEQPESLTDHLRRQRAAVTTRLDELRDLVRAIDNALEETMNEQPMTTQEMKDLFGDAWSEEYQTEAQERWGDTEQWQQSQSRTTGFSKADWARVKAESDAIDAAFVQAMESGEPADGTVAMAAAERHRHAVETHYDCPHAFHVKLAQMYLADPRYTEHFEKQRTSMAQYVHDAIIANAALQR